jgi:hypothetical protein
MVNKQLDILMDYGSGKSNISNLTLNTKWVIQFLYNPF